MTTTNQELNSEVRMERTMRRWREGFDRMVEENRRNGPPTCLCGRGPVTTVFGCDDCRTETS